jgi:cell division protein FtsB
MCWGVNACDQPAKFLPKSVCAGRTPAARSEGRVQMAQAASASAQRAAVRRKQRAAGARPKRATGRSGIRWDRVARAALLGTLGVVLLLYISPAHRWLTQRGLAHQQTQELQALEKQNKQLRSHITLLHDPTALEVEARKLGMVRPGEREYVVRNLPGR